MSNRLAMGVDSKSERGIDAMRVEKHNERTRLLDVIPLGQPYVLMIDPCGACNFRCSFCPCNVSREETAKRHAVMGMDLFQKIVSGIKEFPEKIKAIDMYGFGEPLLNKNLPDMIKMLKEEGVCGKVRLATNASLLDEEMCRRLAAAGLDYMKVSLEALDDEGYRETCGTDMKYKDIVRNIKQFFEISKGGGTEVGVKIVASALQSEQDKIDFYNTFSPISDYTFIENLKPIWAEFGEMVLPPGGTKEADYYTEHTKGYMICSYPLTNMVVHSNGDIGVCCHDWKHATAYANVRTTSLLDAWNSKELRDFQIKHLQRRKNEIPFCNACGQKGYDNVDADAEAIIKKMELSPGS